jgi:hypothetical protein
MGEPLNYTTDCCGAVAKDARGAWHRCSSCGCTFLPSDDEMRRNRVDGREAARRLYGGFARKDERPDDGDSRHRDPNQMRADDCEDTDDAPTLFDDEDDAAQ